MRIKFEALLIVKESLLIIASFIIPNRKVKSCLKIGKLFETLLTPHYPTLLLCLTFYHSNIVHRLNVLRKIIQWQLVSLKSKLPFSYQHISVPDIVPNVGMHNRIILSQSQSSLKTLIKHLKLVVGNRTQSKIVPYFSWIIPQLDKTLVNFRWYLCLLLVVKRGRKWGQCLNIAIL